MPEGQDTHRDGSPRAHRGKAKDSGLTVEKIQQMPDEHIGILRILAGHDDPKPPPEGS
jgi:hypothetical protein